MKIAFGIVMLLIAAVLVVLALRPRLAFHLDEGWKFRDKLQPSELYKGVATFRMAIAAIIAAGLGIWFIAMGIGDRAEDNERAAAEAALQRCKTEILPRFDKTIEWNGKLVANRDQVEALARELGVNVTFERRFENEFDIANVTDPPRIDKVSVYDPAQPRNGGLIFSYRGGPVDGEAIPGSMVQDDTVRCHPVGSSR